MGLGEDGHTNAWSFLPCSGTGTCVCGSIARLSTTRMTCRRPAGAPACPPQSAAPPHPFLHPSRTYPRPQQGGVCSQLFAASSLSPVWGTGGGVTDIGWEGTEAQAMGLSCVSEEPTSRPCHLLIHSCPGGLGLWLWPWSAKTAVIWAVTSASENCLEYF